MNRLLACAKQLTNHAPPVFDGDGLPRSRTVLDGDGRWSPPPDAVCFQKVAQWITSGLILLRESWKPKSVLDCDGRWRVSSPRGPPPSPPDVVCFQKVTQWVQQVTSPSRERSKPSVLDGDGRVSPRGPSPSPPDVPKVKPERSTRNQMVAITS